MVRDYNHFSRQILIDYLETLPEQGDPFWSVREISQRYGCSIYSAHRVLKKFLVEDYLEISPKRGAFLKKHVNLDLLGMTLKACPAFAWSGPRREDPDDFITAYAREVEHLCQKAKLPHVFMNEPNLWEDPYFATRFKAKGSSILVAVSPDPSAVLAFAKLHSADIPILLIGSPRSGYKALVAHSINGDEKEAVHRLLLRLRAEGVRRPLIMGFGSNFATHTKIVEGVQDAFPEIEDVEAAFFAQAIGDEAIPREISARLKGDPAPDALIFLRANHFEMAIHSVPDFLDHLKTLRVAIFDDIGLRRRYPHLPLITLTMPAALLAKKTIEVLQKCVNGFPQSESTLVPMTIDWP